MGQIRYNLLFRLFVGLTMEDRVWDHSVFSKNRDRLLEHEVIESFFSKCWPWLSSKAFVEGPPLGGRHADTGMGQPEEFSSEGWIESASWRRTQHTSKPTGRASLAAMTPMPAKPIRTLGCIARIPTPPLFCATRETY